jgi:polyisoprenoid-binding protein YceI
MFRQLSHMGLILTAVVLFAAGCASTQATPPAATIAPTVDSPTAPPAPTTSVAATPTTTAIGAGAGGDTIRFVLVPEKSEARYRVREQLASLSLPSDAVGSTRNFTGTLVIKQDGTIVPAESKFVVDMQTLQTDRSQRDNFVRRSVLQTDQYPSAVFAPTQIAGLGSPLPTSGPVSFKLTGDLTIRNVTKPVTWDFTGQLQGNELTGQATTSFKFEDFNLTQPRVPVVLSVEDNIKLELDIDMLRQ